MLSGAEAHAQVNVTQEHNNSSRDGVYIDAVFTLSAAENLTRDLNLNGIISGNVYAQPLKDEAAVRTLATMREAGETHAGIWPSVAHEGSTHGTAVRTRARSRHRRRAHASRARSGESVRRREEIVADQCRRGHRRHSRRSGNEPCGVQWHFYDRAHAGTDRARP